MRLVGTLAVIVGLLAPGGVLASHRKASIPPSARAALLTAALRAARTNGDSHPHDIWAVRTTASAAARITLGGTYTYPGPGPAVYLVALRGHFICNTCSHPFGAKAPRGSVITLQLAVSSGESSGSAFGLGNRYPNLRAAGTPVHL